MTPNQIHIGGWVRDNPDIRDWRLPEKAGPPRDLPSKIDLRPQSPPVYDQQSIGSCSSNAVSTVFRFVDMRQGGQNLEPSRLFLYYEARRLQGWQNADTGSYIRDNLKVEADTGAAPEALWPYDVSKFTQPPPNAAYQEAQLHQATGYFRLDQTLNVLKGCLADGFPFALGSSLYENFYEAGRDGMVPMPAGSMIGGHALCYVGYDDAIRRFIVQGSWGMWGARGFIFMPYDYVTDPNLSADCWTIRSVEETIAPKPEPEPPKPDPNHFAFSAIVAVVKPGKLVLDANVTTLPNLKNRRIEITDGRLIKITGKIKNNDEGIITVKGDFDSMLSLRGATVQVETVKD